MARISRTEVWPPSLQARVQFPARETAHAVTWATSPVRHICRETVRCCCRQSAEGGHSLVGKAGSNRAASLPSIGFRGAGEKRRQRGPLWPARKTMGHEIRSDCGHLQTNGPPFILLFPSTLYYVTMTSTFAPENFRPFRTHHGTSAAAPLHGGCTSTDRAMALGLQNRCRIAARERSPFGRFGGEIVVPAWARQGETTRYSTLITSADADILAAPAAALRSPGCSYPDCSTGWKSGARWARAEGR